jgi:hypothetical protein
MNARTLGLPHHYDQIEIELIETPKNRVRPVTKEGVDRIIKSFETSGDFGCIVVRRDLVTKPSGPRKWIVVCGANRAEAHRQMGRVFVTAACYEELSDEAALIMECDENLVRNEMTAEQTHRAISLRLKAFEKLHPPMTKAEAGAEGGKAKAAAQAGEVAEPKVNSARVSEAVKETAKATGRSASAIKRGSKAAVEDMEERHYVSGEAWESIAADYGYENPASAKDAVSKLRKHRKIVESATASILASRERDEDRKRKRAVAEAAPQSAPPQVKVPDPVPVNAVGHDYENRDALKLYIKEKIAQAIVLELDKWGATFPLSEVFGEMAKTRW